MKQLLVMLLLCGSLHAHSQSTDAALNKRLAEYLQFSKELKVDQLLNYMYPRVFELAKRADLKQVLSAAFNNPDIDIQLDSLQIGKVDDISKSSKGVFTKFSYSSLMRVQLKSEKMKPHIDAVVSNFSKQFGAENVRLDAATQIITVVQTKEALAIKDNYSKNLWTMLGLEKSMNAAAILSPEIKKKYSLH